MNYHLLLKAIAIAPYSESYCYTYPQISKGFTGVFGNFNS